MVGTLSAQTDPVQSAFESTVAPFFKNHCQKCHGPDKQKSDRRFDQLVFPVTNDEQLADYQDILDQL
ncbi:MAG: hypothetical protein HOL08_17855, partial [Opitutae bacterium]|nr:hypothetical protein [Opitutae bacterium]